jgi:hypothetical protein
MSINREPFQRTDISTQPLVLEHLYVLGTNPTETIPIIPPPSATRPYHSYLIKFSLTCGSILLREAITVSHERGSKRMNNYEELCSLCYLKMACLYNTCSTVIKLLCCDKEI